jgi:hypothetical protein
MATRAPADAITDDTVIFGPVALETTGGNVLSVLIRDPALGEDALVIIDDLMP